MSAITPQQMGIAYSPVNRRQYKIITKQGNQGALPSIERITNGSELKNDIYLIPFVAEKRYRTGYPLTSQRAGWTFDFGDINSEDIFILDSRWDRKTMAFFATCLWDAPNYTGKPLIDNGWEKGSFSPASSDFYTHEGSIELGYFHNKEFSPKPTQFYCADFSKIKLKDFRKTTSSGAYEMDAKKFMAKYQDLLCDARLDNCCSVNNQSISYAINQPAQFKRNYADKITNFKPSNDTLEINTDSFGIDSPATFAAGKNKRIVKKKLAKFDIEFLYDKKKGGLYFNENGTDKGFGAGGIVAILKGAPELTLSNWNFI